jgi:outer membrane protein assembly factor BamB
VPAGSLLLFKGYPQNGNSSVVAINPANGAALASLQMQGNYYSTAGLYDDSSKHLFLLSETYNQMVEVNATTGSEIGRYSLPVNIQGTAGIAIDPADGNFWLSGSNAGSQLVKVDRQGVELRRVDLAGQGIPNGQVSGISFAADGTLRISSNQGVIYQAKIS